MTTEKDEGLKRLGGGRWQTRDERFTIEPQSGTWAVIDAEQTDDLGLPLVRGPFGSLGAAKEAIAEARTADVPASSLKDRAKAQSPPVRTPAKPAKGSKATEAKAAEPEEPKEPRWMRDLESDERRRAARLIDRLTAAGARDAEGIVRRDVVGEVSAVAGFALEQAIRGLGASATPADVADLLADGRDAGLGVRWRLVDADGRPIPFDRSSLERE